MATTKVARMTPQTEGRIVRAVEDAIDQINDGADPNDAITKVAADAQLPPGHVGLLVAAYNTGRANRQREGSTRLVEKAADFPVADPAVILERLYPKVVKSSAQVERETSVSPDYLAPPTWLERARGRAAFEKAAAAAPRLVDAAPAPYAADPAVRVKRAYHAAIDRDRKVEESRRLFSRAQDDLVHHFQKLAAWFADPAHPTVADVRDNVEALWGDAGARVLDHLGKTRPALVKRAAHGAQLRVERTAEPYRTLGATLDATEEVRRARDVYDRDAREATARTAAELAPFVPARRESPLGLPSVTPSAEKQAGPYTTALGVQLTRDLLGRVGEGLEVPGKDQLVDKALRNISSPDHEQQLRSIHTQAMLHNMIANDPIISGYHPHEIAEAFNQVSQLAPHAATQPAVIGPLLRSWLQQGNLPTFESGQLVDTEQKLKQIHAPSPGKESLLHGQRPTSVLA